MHCIAVWGRLYTRISCFQGGGNMQPVNKTTLWVVLMLCATVVFGASNMTGPTCQRRLLATISASSERQRQPYAPVARLRRASRREERVSVCVRCAALSTGTGRVMLGADWRTPRRHGPTNSGRCRLMHWWARSGGRNDKSRPCSATLSAWRQCSRNAHPTLAVTLRRPRR